MHGSTAWPRRRPTCRFARKAMVTRRGTTPCGFLPTFQPALDGGDVFAVFVRDVPVALLRETLNVHRLMGELMVLDRYGRVVVHSKGLATQADTSLGRRGLQAGAWRRGFDGLNVGYRDGVFTINQIGMLI